MDGIIQAIAGGVVSLILGIGAFVMKTVHSRIDVLERELPHKLNEPAVRQIVSDKIDPIREDIHEIKAKLDRVMDILIERK